MLPLSPKVYAVFPQELLNSLLAEPGVATPLRTWSPQLALHLFADASFKMSLATILHIYMGVYVYIYIHTHRCIYVHIHAL